MAKKPTQKPEHGSSDQGMYPFFANAGQLMRAVGIQGFIVLMGAYTFLWVFTTSQRAEMIDKFILFKADQGQGHMFCSIAVSALLAINIATYYFSRKTLAIEKRENERLERYISRIEVPVVQNR
jgi:hypothetical protein